MKNVFLLGVYILSVVVIVGLFFISVKRYKKQNKSIALQSLMYSQKNKYLIRCLKYHSIINKQKICNTRNCDFIVYYTGQTCSSCVESLLLMLNIEYELEDNIIILVDDNTKEDFILSLNDGFHMNYECFRLIENSFLPLNDVLLIKMNNGKVINILEYRPEEKYFFKEYFNHFKFMENVTTYTHNKK